MSGSGANASEEQASSPTSKDSGGTGDEVW